VRAVAIRFDGGPLSKLLGNLMKFSLAASLEDRRCGKITIDSITLANTFAFLGRTDAYAYPVSNPARRETVLGVRSANRSTTFLVRPLNTRTARPGCRVKMLLNGRLAPEVHKTMAAFVWSRRESRST